MIINDKEIISGGRNIVSTIDDLVESGTEFQTILGELAENGFADVLIKSEIQQKEMELTWAITKLNEETRQIMKIVYDYIEDIDKQEKHITILE